MSLLNLDRQQIEDKLKTYYFDPDHVSIEDLEEVSIMCQELAEIKRNEEEDDEYY